MATKAGAGKTVNKGEGSEFYAFLYILGETKLPLVDKDLKETGRDVNFLKVLREDAIYEFTSGKRVAVYVDGATHYFDCSQAQEEAKKVFSLLVNPGSIPTNAPALSSALKLVCAKKLRAKSANKQDLSASVQFPNVPFSQFIGFSVKSYVGKDPTILNASGDNTRFVYRILKNGQTPSGDELARLKSFYPTTVGNSKIGTYADFYRNALRDGFSFNFKENSGGNLSYNLKFIDSKGPELLARILMEQFAAPRTRTPLADLVDEAARKNDIPEIQALGDNFEDRRNSLRHKIQNSLLAFTTGATPAVKWTGAQTASGGLLVVEKSGKVYCLELLSGNVVGNYLIENAYFEQPSGDRHSKNVLTISPSEVTIDLQLQIRIQHP